MDYGSYNSSERAKARWSTLRSAITKKQFPSSDVLQKHSIHRFAGFRLLTRRQIPLADVKLSDVDSNVLSSLFPSMDWKNSENGLSYSMVSKSSQVQEEDFDVVEYETPLPEVFQSMLGNKEENTSLPTSLRFRTRERKLTSDGMQTKVHLHELNSQSENDGVDNTGNIRVWDSSITLAYLLLHGSCTSKCIPMPASQSNPLEGLYTPDTDPLIGIHKILSLATGNTSKRLRVIEMGAGMAGLSSLLLWTLNSTIQEYSLDAPTIDITVTDGHARCIHNNIISAALTSQMISSTLPQTIEVVETESSFHILNLRVQRLLWKSGEDGALDCQKLFIKREDDVSPHGHGFDLCLVSDCIHFVEHHAALAITIGRLLRIDGVCLLCQPARGDSLRKFMLLLEAINAEAPLFEIHCYEYYDDVIYKRHLDLLEENGSQIYEPSLHYPLLLTLRKCRLFSEAMDTATAISAADRIRI